MSLVEFKTSNNTQNAFCNIQIWAISSYKTKTKKIKKLKNKNPKPKTKIYVALRFIDIMQRSHYLEFFFFKRDIYRLIRTPYLCDLQI